MRQDGALRFAGRPGGVDDRRGIRRADSFRARLEHGRAHLEISSPAVDRAEPSVVAGLGRRFGVDRENVLQRGTLLPDRPQLFQLFRRRGDGNPRAGIVQDLNDRFCRKRGVDRNGQGAPADDRVIGDRPFRTVLREDRDPVSRLHSQRVQAQGERADREGEIARRDRLPFVAVAREEKILSVGPRGNLEDVVQSLDLGHRASGLARL